MRGLDDLVRSGKVLYLGISDTPAWIVSQANMLADLRGWTAFSALQIPYSLVERSPERDLLPMARSLDLAVTPWGILGERRSFGKVQPRRQDGREGERAGARSLKSSWRLPKKPRRWPKNWASPRARPRSRGSGSSPGSSFRFWARAPWTS